MIEDIQKSLRNIVLALKQLDGIKSDGNLHLDCSVSGSFYKANSWDPKDKDGNSLHMVTINPFERGSFENVLFTLVQVFTRVCNDTVFDISSHEEVEEYLMQHKNINGPEEIKDVYSQIFDSFAKPETKELYKDNENFCTLKFCIYIFEKHILTDGKKSTLIG